jgi:hypothetical protein
LAGCEETAQGAIGCSGVVGADDPVSGSGFPPADVGPDGQAASGAVDDELGTVALAVPDTAVSCVDSDTGGEATDRVKRAGWSTGPQEPRMCPETLTPGAGRAGSETG